MPFLTFRMHPKNHFFQLPNRPLLETFPPKKSTMYFNDFLKMVIRKNMIFDALYRANMVLQGNHFLKYLKILKNMTLCTEPSQGLKPVDLGVSWKPLSLFGKIFGP